MTRSASPRWPGETTPSASTGYPALSEAERTRPRRMLSVWACFTASACWAQLVQHLAQLGDPVQQLLLGDHQRRREAHGRTVRVLRQHAAGHESLTDLTTAR